MSIPSRTDTLAPFTELGERIAHRWLSLQYDDERFAALAEEELAAAHLPERVDALGLLRAAAMSSLPPQLDEGTTFGEPPITLFRHPRFVIDVYGWFSSTTTIHEHAFSGAFQVLRGGSIHSEYAFEETRRVSARLRFGNTRFLRASRLRQGDLHRIHRGGALVHALYHLEHPSFSIVVRTTNEPGNAPQYQYTREGLCFDPFYYPEGARRRLEILGAVLRMDPAAYLEAALDYLSRADLFEGFLLLSGHAVAISQHPAVRAGLHAAVRTRFGNDGSEIIRGGEDTLRSRTLAGLRRKIVDPRQRLVLALLLNVPTREAIEDILRREGADDPAGEVVSLLRTLSTHGHLTVKLSEAQLAVVHRLARGLDDEALLRDLAEEYDEGDVSAAADVVRRYRPILAREPLLRGLLA